jgi:hypothetical protein
LAFRIRKDPNQVAGAFFSPNPAYDPKRSGGLGLGRPFTYFTVIRLTRTRGGTIYPHRQETKELAMDANRSGRGGYTARQDFLVRVTIAVAMFYGFVVSVSL